MKIKLLLKILLLFTGTIYAQTGINTSEPNSNTLLHVSEKIRVGDPDNENKLKGIIIPRLTEAERDKLTYENSSANPKVLKLFATDNSLLIYNTTENCYNYWNYLEKEWKSLCGKLGKAEFTFNCPSDVTVFGTYIQGKELTNSHYLAIKVNVTKPGEYVISATTTNGYSFFASGTFLNVGNYTVSLLGQGTPVNVGLNDLDFNANGLDIECNPAKQVNVLTAAGTYTIGCKEIVVNGVYKQGTALNSTNTITVPVTVTATGSWSMYTNTVDGISFSGSGTFSGTGNFYVTLNGTGIPTSTLNKKMTLTHNSGGLENSGCQFDVVVTIPTKKLLTIGDSKDIFGYNFAGTAASGKMIREPRNYGTQVNSVVKFEGFNIIDGGTSPTQANLRNWLLGSEPVDIVILGYSWTMSAAEADIFSEYILKNGVVIAFSESNAGNTRLFQTLFNNLNISSSSVNAAGALYKLPVVNDEVMNGPFGDIRGKFWGEDASSTTRTVGLPLNEIEIYSSDADYSQATPTSSGAITAFRHKNFNLIWVGDGGFNSNEAGTSEIICPFKLDINNYPTFKNAYGRGVTTRDQPVYNAVFTANALAWAIRKAEFNGINTK